MGWMDGWDGRLSPSASLLRAPYGANKKIEFATHPPKNNKKIIIICSQSIKLGWLYTEGVIIEKCHPCTFYKVKNSQYSFPLGTES